MLGLQWEGIARLFASLSTCAACAERRTNPCRGNPNIETVRDKGMMTSGTCRRAADARQRWKGQEHDHAAVNALSGIFSRRLYQHAHAARRFVRW